MQRVRCDHAIALTPSPVDPRCTLTFRIRSTPFAIDLYSSPRSPAMGGRGGIGYKDDEGHLDESGDAIHVMELILSELMPPEVTNLLESWQAKWSLDPPCVHCRQNGPQGAADVHCARCDAITLQETTAYHA